MRRLFYQEKIYDYSSVVEAERHIIIMEKAGWHAKVQGDRKRICDTQQSEYPYSVTFFKEC